MTEPLSLEESLQGDFTCSLFKSTESIIWIPMKSHKLGTLKQSKLKSPKSPLSEQPRVKSVASKMMPNKNCHWNRSHLWNASLILLDRDCSVDLKGTWEVEDSKDESGIEDLSPPRLVNWYHLQGKKGTSRVPRTAVTAPYNVPGVTLCGRV